MISFYMWYQSIFTNSSDLCNCHSADEPDQNESVNPIKIGGGSFRLQFFFSFKRPFLPTKFTRQALQRREMEQFIVKK